MRSPRRPIFQSGCSTKPCLFDIGPCLRVKGMDKICVPGQSYVKVLDISWIWGVGGAGCIVSPRIKCMRSHADAFSKAPNSARVQKGVVREDLGTLDRPGSEA